MLHPNIVQLKQFYASKLGNRVAGFVGQALLGAWPEIRGDSMLVIGYGAPYIATYVHQASAFMMAMPAEQGAAAWPASGPNHVVLTNEGELPLQNNSINRVLLIHSIEYSEHLNAMMQEVWRVLVPGGRVMAVVPNRMSLWAGSARTPFGFGRPFNVLQLRGLLTHHHFTITHSYSALFAPPFIVRLSQRMAAKVEAVGKFLWWFLGGVLITEAEKQLYAGVKEPLMARKPYRLRAAAATANMSNPKK